MRTTQRLLAAVKPAARFLEPGTMTGITGLWTHPTPRSTLLYLYQRTLDKLQAAPEHSVYRQSVEALTRHRMQAVQSVVPAGYEAWVEKASRIVQGRRDRLRPGVEVVETSEGRLLTVHEEEMEREKRILQAVEAERHGLDEVEARGIFNPKPESAPEGSEGEAAADKAEVEEEWEEEPLLTAAQISELETKLGAGLIEEVIQVAEGELKLVDTMVENKVWESLEEPPAEGQWVYFERKA